MCKRERQETDRETYLERIQDWVMGRESGWMKGIDAADLARQPGGAG
jgi:hypothetical protein